MTIASVWLTKLLLSHLLTDFILQPKSWVADRNAKHFASGKLYLHGLITGLMAMLLIGPQYWMITLFILITHTLIDGWKSYRPATVTYFLIDQLLHILIITGCWCFIFLQWNDVQTAWKQLNTQPVAWKIITAFIFLT